MWGDVHEAALTKVKEIITNPAGPILKHFDPKLPIRLLTDASRSGIGFCLVQTEVGNKIPQIPTEATRPFERFSIDLGTQKGKDYLIGMDRYSGWPMAAPIPKKANTKVITDILDEWFIDHGLPVSIRTDGGPQFRGPFKAWCARHHIRHELASAYHHESNGHAECAVREVKKLLAKTPSYDAFRRALRSYRNCPRYDGLSPAQWSVGRQQRTDAVAFPAAYNRIPDDVIAKHEAKRKEKAEKLRSHADKSSRPKMHMQPGQHVIAQHLLTKRWDQRAVIMESRSNGRSYIININGRSYLRNRRFLRPNREPNQTRSMGTPIPRKATSTGPPAVRQNIDRPSTRQQICNGRPEEPRRTYPAQERRQRTHYQAANPEPRKRHRQT
jgi:hypothetical protein